jgi:selenophosphate synthetase-related protein
LFGEDQSRYIIEVNEKNIEEVSNILRNNSIYFEKIGKTQQDYLEVKNEFKASLNELGELHKYWFNNYFKENI